jgi:hypothetical protein
VSDIGGLQRHMNNLYSARRWDERYINNSYSKCRWGDCDMILGKAEVRAHLKVANGVAMQASAYPGVYCVYCFEWYYGEFKWEAYCNLHIKELQDMNCFPTCSQPEMCPFCVGNDELVPP